MKTKSGDMVCNKCYKFINVIDVNEKTQRMETDAIVMSFYVGEKRQFFDLCSWNCAMRLINDMTRVQ